MFRAASGGIVAFANGGIQPNFYPGLLVNRAQAIENEKEKKNYGG